MKVSNLTPKQLDSLVCQLEKEDWYPHQSGESWYSPTTNWEQGGPIIEREGISIIFHDGFCSCPKTWYAYQDFEYDGIEVSTKFGMQGTTSLIAAMRCYVASKLGDEVDLPKELT